MSIQGKDKSFPDENFHGQLKYSTGTGMNLLLSNQIGNTTVNVRKATDVSIEGVTQLEHGQVQLHVSRLVRSFHLLVKYSVLAKRRARTSLSNQRPTMTLRGRWR